MAEGLVEAGLGFEDQTAALFEGGELREAMSATEGARVWRVGAESGFAEEQARECRALTASRPAIDEARAEIIEMRQTLAARAAARRGRRGGPRG